MMLNLHAIRALYTFEMARTFRTLMQSIISPVISTSLYFVVFGAAIGSRIQEVDGISYGAFIIPGLIMLSLLTESISNASFGIYMPKYSGTIYEILSAPISAVETVIGYVGAAATKSLILGVLILATARFFVDYEIQHPFWMAAFLVLTALSFSMFGFILGIWADSFERLQVVPLLIVMPLTFLGGSFPLELLWFVRCRRGTERARDPRLPCALHGDHLVHLQDRVPAEGVRLSPHLAQRP